MDKLDKMNFHMDRAKRQFAAIEKCLKILGGLHDLELAHNALQVMIEKYHQIEVGIAREDQELVEAVVLAGETRRMMEDARP